VTGRTSQLEDARLETLRRLALVAEYRDDETFEHTERVGHTSALIAQGLGWSPTEVERLRLAAPLHDIGKIGLPDAVLLKPGELTSSEFASVKRHTTDGAALLSGSRSDVLNLAETIALCHHEWWDGTGYPRGLIGPEIPMCARIVAVADVFDALTHSRPYKSAWPVDAAVAEIQKLSDMQFDPPIVETFMGLDHVVLADIEPAEMRRAA
jgi:putative two-component system response regulator